MKAADTDLKKHAYQFIATNRAASLATVDKKGMPNVVPLYCVADEDLTIYFSTRVEGRKFINLMQNSIVAMSFMNEKKLSAIQLFERGATNEIAIIKVTPREMTYANFENIKPESHNQFFQKVI